MSQRCQKRLFAAFDRRVGGHEVAVIGDMVGEKCAQPIDVVAPVAVQLASNGEPGDGLRAGCRHAVPRGMPRNLVECARGVGHDEDLVAFLHGRQRRKRDAHFRDHAGDDELLLAGRLNSFDEVLIVPGVDLAGTWDERRGWKLLL